MTVLPKPAHPLDVWLGGKAPSELRRVGRLADGWLASFSTPEDCKAARVAIEDAADAAGRAIDDDHFGAMVLLHARRDPRRARRGRSRPATPAPSPTTSSRAAGRSCASCASATSPSASRSSCSSRSPSPTTGTTSSPPARGSPAAPELSSASQLRQRRGRYASRKRRRPIIEPITPMPAPMASTSSADHEHVVRARVERLEQVVLVLQQLRDDPLQDVHEPDREAGADRALHEALGHERHAHEPVRRADELHDLDLTPARERREPDRVHDQEQRRREQHAGQHEEGPAGSTWSR